MLELHSLTVRYGRLAAASEVSLRLDPGQIGCLLGPSGCGKTSILRAIAGFLSPASGAIHIGGADMGHGHSMVPPEQRQVGIIPQDLALFPHLTIRQNVGFGVSHLDREQRRARVVELLSLTGMLEYAASYPHQVSGGQQQRVAIARALAPRPRLLLLDEPFASLDPKLRESLPRELRRVFRAEQVTALLVTHDQNEAFAMSDMVGVMHDGRLEQWDTAYGVYHKPGSARVARFVGEGVLLKGHTTANGTVETELGSFAAESAPVAGENVQVLIRPDDVVHDDASPVQARVVSRAFRGSHYLFELELGSGDRILCLAPSHHDHEIGEAIGIRLDLTHVVTFAQ